MMANAGYWIGLTCLFAVCWSLFATDVVQCTTTNSRIFEIDYENNRFVKDGKPFQYVAGEMHYFRVPAPLWRDRLRKMKFGGLNAVQTYVEWSSHEPSPGVYDFDGDNNITRFIEEAQQEGLLVILRVGPYICAERDMGGLPPWLLKINPNIKLRSSDPSYLKPVDRWLNVFLPLVKPFLYKNGGPVIMLQIENEYGSYGACDFNYTTHLRDYFHEQLGNDTILFTTDGSGDSFLLCGQVPKVLATIDFGTGSNVTENFNMLRRHQKHGPFVNSEFYSGWIDYWENQHSTVNTEAICKELDWILSNNASVSIYMYHGGTNFAFKAGSNNFGTFNPVPTSYDYDAPISEAGDLTPKFYAIKKVIEKYISNDAPVNSSINSVADKMHLGPVEMRAKASIFDVLPKPIEFEKPLTFEQVGLNYGFMLYSTNITFHPPDPAVLKISDLRDRAQVFVDKSYAGTLSRTGKIFDLSLLLKNPSTVDILVENQGRNSFGPKINEQKGIISNVTISSSRVLTKWNHYKLFDNWNKVLSQVEQIENGLQSIGNDMQESRIPSFYVGQFTLPNMPNYPLDSFLKVSNWHKGVAFLNGHNLGRYWPVAGPQLTLYAPAVYFNKYPKPNRIVLFELEKSPCGKGKCHVEFVKHHVVNGSYPFH